MQQFAYRATDRLGNVLDGNVMADNHSDAIRILQSQSLTPIGVQLAGAVAVQEPTVSMTLTPNRPRDLTAPVTVMPTAAADLFAETPVPATLNITMEFTPDIGLAAYQAPGQAASASDDMQARMANLEPWERSAIDPTSGLPRDPNATLQMPPVLERPRYRAQTVRGLENIPFGANSSREVPLAQRAKEGAVLPAVFRCQAQRSGPMVSAIRYFDWRRPKPQPEFDGTGRQYQERQAKGDYAGWSSAGSRRRLLLRCDGGLSLDFPPMHLEMLRASEHGGLIEDTLRQVGDYVEHEMEVRRLISRETLYPKIVLVVLVMLMGRSGIFHGQPAIATWFLGGPTGQYFLDTIGFALGILIPILGMVALFRLFAFNSASFRNLYDQVKINLPVLGKIIRNFAISKFARTYAALSAAGFPSSSALQIAGDASGNVVMARAGQYAMRKAEQGCLPSESLYETRQFSTMTIDMLRTAEMSGSVDDMMVKVADYHEAEAKSATHTVAMIFSVGVLLLVGIIVGSVVIGAYTGGANALKAAGAE